MRASICTCSGTMSSFLIAASMRDHSIGVAWIISWLFSSIAEMRMSVSFLPCRPAPAASCPRAVATGRVLFADRLRTQRILIAHRRAARAAQPRCRRRRRSAAVAERGRTQSRRDAAGRAPVRAAGRRTEEDLAEIVGEIRRLEILDVVDVELRRVLRATPIEPVQPLLGLLRYSGCGVITTSDWSARSA